MRLPAIAAMALALSACAAKMPPPAVVVRTVEVDRPVPVPCARADQIPAVPAKVGDRLTGDAVADADTLAAVDLRLRAALDQALALLGPCTATAP
jgi:hypothetical protein